MKRFLLIIFLSAGLLPHVFAQNILPRPNPPTLVNDEAHVLSDYDRGTLEARLVAFDDSTSNQIVVVTIPTLNDYPIEDYANKLLRAWGIGTKKNNGILLLIAVNDHKVRIEVGYGLEGAIPDVTASDIIENDIKPAFRQGNYYSGISNAVEDLAQAAAGEYHQRRERDGDGGNGSGWVGFIIIVVVVIIIFARGSRGGGGMMSSRGSGWLIWPMIFGGFGGGWGDGGGRNSGGWGGSSGGGGFGGFGGGSSGGGGASGGW